MPLPRLLAVAVSGVQHNQICTLKGSLTSFHFLDTLDLSGNQLRDLDKLVATLQKLPFLTYLNLQVGFWGTATPGQLLQGAACVGVFAGSVCGEAAVCGNTVLATMHPASVSGHTYLLATHYVCVWCDACTHGCHHHR